MAAKLHPVFPYPSGDSILDLTLLSEAGREEAGLA